MSFTEQERLLNYYPFDKDVVNTVAEVADRQRSVGWETIQSSLPENKTFTAPGYKPIELIDVIPDDDYESVHVYHLPMANALDENMLIRISALAQALPTSRIVAFGNPGAPGQGKGKISAVEFREVWGGDVRPFIEPSLRYLSSQGIDTASQIGYSYGAERAVTSAQYANRHDLNIPIGIFMEPVTAHARTLIELGRDFGRTAEPLDDYVKAANSEAYSQARQLAEKRGHGPIGYALGLARLSNLAVAHALAKESFQDKTNAALTSQSDLKANIVWGSESEMLLAIKMRHISQVLKKRFGAQRVNALEIPGQRHAMGDDIYLHTAIVLEALNSSS